jgi:hypothetical protein
MRYHSLPTLPLHITRPSRRHCNSGRGFGQGLLALAPVSPLIRQSPMLQRPRRCNGMRLKASQVLSGNLQERSVFLGLQQPIESAPGQQVAADDAAHAALIDYRHG